jgi:hypothetical protein
MSPDAAKAMYRRLIAASGETVTLRRNSRYPADPTDADVRARVIDATTADADDDSLQQGKRKVVVLAEDVPEGFWPLRERGVDRIILRGAPCTIDFVDDSTRRVGGVLIAYEFHVIGGR